jgi:hypothetical protein
MRQSSNQCPGQNCENIFKKELKKKNIGGKSWRCDLSGRVLAQQALGKKKKAP